MICEKCKKEIADDSKFCEFCGSMIENNKIENDKKSNEFFGMEIQSEKPKETKVSNRKYLGYFKNIILISSLFAILSYIDEFLAIPLTILIVFVYHKISKKFNL